MARKYDAFDAGNPELIEAERKLFEADAAPYGFNLTRYDFKGVEPWSDYASDDTGHRWGGWLAARELSSNVMYTPK